MPVTVTNGWALGMQQPQATSSFNLDFRCSMILLLCEAGKTEGCYCNNISKLAPHCTAVSIHQQEGIRRSQRQEQQLDTTKAHSV